MNKTRNWLLIKDGVITDVLELEDNRIPNNKDGVFDTLAEDFRKVFKKGEEYSIKEWRKRYGEKESTASYTTRLPATEFPDVPKSAKRKTKTYGNIWVREVQLEKKDDRKNGHKHDFDHLHFLATGSAKITAYKDDDRKQILLSKEYVSPAWIKVPKEHFHDIVALEDNTTGYCIQSLRNSNDEICQTNYILDEDYMNEVKAYEAEHGTKDEIT